jgi:hypothetical protein
VLWTTRDKGYLKSRPMPHWTDKSIFGHIMLSFLTHFCEAYLIKPLRQANTFIETKSSDKNIIKPRPLTVVPAMNQLMQVIAVPDNVKKETIWLRTDIPTNVIKLLKAIGMKIPPKILSN